MTATCASGLDQLLALAVAHHRAGALRDAKRLYERILRKSPPHPEANHLLGLIASAEGDHERAESLIRLAISVDPEFAPYHLNLGNALQAAGRPEQAATCFRRALDLDPRLTMCYYNLGNSLQQSRDFAEAVESYRKYLALSPHHAEAWQNLGLALESAGDHAAGIEAFQKALSIDPRLSACYAALAISLQARGEHRAAIEYHRRYLEAHPGRADAHYALALAYAGDLDYEGAIEHLRIAAKLDPTVPEVYLALGDAFLRARQYKKARCALRVALKLRPNYPDADRVLTIARTADEYLTRDEAGDVARKCARWTQPGAIARVGVNLVASGHALEGLQLLDSLDSPGTPAGERVRAATVLPTLPGSEEDIDFWRRRFSYKVDQLRKERIRIADPLREVGQTNFYLAYHSRNDRVLQEKIAKFYLEACPSLAWRAPHCEPYGRRSGDKIRVGLVSQHLKYHTIGKLNCGLIDKLDRERFHVSVFHVADKRKPDAWARRISESADHSETLSGGLEGVREAIGSRELDILFYPDIGMEPHTYFLAFARLAPVQCVTWGHPVTTGIPAIDYFISSRDLDLDGAQEFYSERLVRLAEHPVCYFKPGFSPPEKRTLLNQYPGLRLYVCLQSLFKLHPAFDRVVRSILSADPSGIVVFIRGVQDHMEGQLRARFQVSMPDVLDRVVFVPRLPPAQFLELAATADVLLDTPYFGGGNTSYEAFAVGAPIVTLERPLMRERITPVLYRQMAIHDLIASDEDEYVRLAVRCASDREWRESLRRRILAAAPALYERVDGIRDLERFFEAAAEAAAAGKSISGWE